MQPYGISKNGNEPSEKYSQKTKHFVICGRSPQTSDISISTHYPHNQRLVVDNDKKKFCLDKTLTSTRQISSPPTFPAF